MMIIRNLLLCFLMLSTSLLSAKSLPFANGEHIFHLSMCEIDYNAKVNSLEISLKIFIDDFELALERKEGYKMLKIGSEKEHKKADQYILDYLKESFIIENKDGPLNYEFIGKELDEDLIAIWCYLEITNVPQPKDLTITNSVLTEVYDDQNNIINIQISKEQTGYLMLNRAKTSETIHFK